jgi:hypothetical protein
MEFILARRCGEDYGGVFVGLRQAAEEETRKRGERGG